nr:MAG TPA_asm: hypothetical protein [Caudoviricetes sp.]
MTASHSAVRAKTFLLRAAEPDLPENGRAFLLRLCESSRK